MVTVNDVKEVNAASVVDVLVASNFKATSTTYVEFSGVQKDSGAIYAGKSAKTNTGGIQLRSSKSEDGIVTTASGGTAKSISVEWESSTTTGRTIDIYGKSTAYSKATDLYNSNKGTKIGSIKCGTSTDLVISGEYQYLGIRSNSGALYLSEVKITWEAGGEITPVEPTLSLNESSATIYEGSTYKIEVTTNQDDISFVSSATNIATVDENGLITAVSAGNANITVSAGTLSETFAVTVEAIPEDQKNDYVKVTSTPSNWEGEYLIVCESKSVAFDGSLTSLDGVGNKVDVTITDGKIAYSPDLDNKDFTIESISSGGYSIKSSSGYYIGQTSYANGLASNTSTKYANTLSVDSSGNAIIKVSSGPTLKYNSASDQVRFRYYKSGQTAVSLYKKVDNTVVENEECKENVKTYNGFANLAYKYTVSEVTYDAGYRVIADKNEIKDGSSVVIVSVDAEGNRYALTNSSTTDNTLDAASVVAENGYLTSFEGATEWAVSGNPTNGYTLSDGENYLKTTSGTELKVASNGSSFVVKSDEKGNFYFLGERANSSPIYAVDSEKGNYFKNYATSNLGKTSNGITYSNSLEIYVKYDGETATNIYTESEFRLQVGVNTAEMATLLSKLPSGAKYGIEVTAPVGIATQKQFTQEELEQKTSTDEATSATYNYAVISLKDVMNNLDRATVVFTVKVFVEYEGQIYYSDIAKEYSVANMVKAYYDNGDTRVSGLYNVLLENGIYNDAVEA